MKSFNDEKWPRRSANFALATTLPGSSEVQSVDSIECNVCSLMSWDIGHALSSLNDLASLLDSRRQLKHVFRERRDLLDDAGSTRSSYPNGILSSCSEWPLAR